jgi:hypothetical protein
MVGTLPETFIIWPEVKQGYSLNLSILLSEGKETN